MLDAIPSALTVCLLVYVWVSGGLSHWAAMGSADAQTNDDALALFLGFGWQARLVKISFVAIWPFWLALGLVLALIAHHRSL